MYEGNFPVFKSYIFKSQPGPVAKNTTEVWLLLLQVIVLKVSAQIQLRSQVRPPTQYHHF